MLILCDPHEFLIVVMWNRDGCTDRFGHLPLHRHKGASLYIVSMKNRTIAHHCNFVQYASLVRLGDRVRLGGERINAGSAVASVGHQQGGRNLPLGNERVQCAAKANASELPVNLKSNSSV